MCGQIYDNLISLISLTMSMIKYRVDGGFAELFPLARIKESRKLVWDELEAVTILSRIWFIGASQCVIDSRQCFLYLEPNADCSHRFKYCDHLSQYPGLGPSLCVGRWPRRASEVSVKGGLGRSCELACAAEESTSSKLPPASGPPTLVWVKRINQGR